jgi:hypothetical protein
VTAGGSSFRRCVVARSLNESNVYFSGRYDWKIDEPKESESSECST